MNNDIAYDDRSEIKIRDHYPFPIAYLFTHDLLNGRDAEKQVRGIIHTFENSLRYLAALLLAEYAQYPEQDETVSRLINSLYRPSIGDIQKFIRQGIKRLDDCGHDWFVAELPEYVKNVQRVRGLSPSTSLIDSLLSLRNRLAHWEYAPSWVSLRNEYYPLLIEFLRHLQFLTRYPLVRFVKEVDDNFCVIASLMGYGGEFTEKVIPRPDIVESTLPGLFLLSDGQRAPLPLHPFIVMHPCEKCIDHSELPKLTEEVFLLNGGNDFHIRLIGVRHTLELTDTGFASFNHRKTFVSPRVDAESMTIEALNARVKHVSQLMIDAQTRHSIYIPEVYMPRHEMESELERFLNNDRSAFLLLGESGIGKTSLLCHWATELLEKSISALYYPAADLDLRLLDQMIIADLKVNGTFSNLLLSPWQTTSVPMVIIIDGLNENSNVIEAIRQLDQFINTYRHTRLKLVFSLRTSHFGSILERLVDTRFDPQGDSFFSHDKYHTSLVYGAHDDQETYQNTLTKIDADSPELEIIYEKYRNLRESHENSQSGRFCPKTPFDQLSKQVRDLISNPWYLRLAMEIYHDREMPSRIYSTDLVRAYCQQLIYYREDTADMVDQLIDILFRQRVTSVTRSVLEKDAALKNLMIGTLYEPSTYRRLVEDGVLVEYPETNARGIFTVTGCRVQFAFDRVLEFLIANKFLSNNTALTTEAIQSIAHGSAEYAPLSGAIQIIWFLTTQADNGDLILKSIEECDGAILQPMISTLRELEAHSHPAFDRILMSVAQGDSFKFGFLLLGLGEGMGIENGIGAQNRVFETLYDWNGESARGFRFFAGRYLMFGYLIANMEEKATDIYNQMQQLYADETNTTKSLITFDKRLTPEQRERICKFAWIVSQCGMSILAKTHNKPTEIDKMLSRLKLDSISAHLRHDLATLINQLAHMEVATSTEAAMRASISIAEAEGTDQAEHKLKAFDQIGININQMVIEQMPKVLKEVELELSFLNNAIQPLFHTSEGKNEVIEAAIHSYIGDRREPMPSLKGKISQIQSMIGNSLIMYYSYKQIDNNEKWIEHLMRAESYVLACEASADTLEIYSLMMKAAEELNSRNKYHEYSDRYLEFDIYLGLSKDTRSVLIKDDIFELFMKDIGAEGSQADYFRSHLNREWIDNLFERCSPYLSFEEVEKATELIEVESNPDIWEDLLRGQVFNYDQLRAEQRVIEVIKLLLLLKRESSIELEGKDLTPYDYVQARLLLISMRSSFFTPFSEREAKTQSIKEQRNDVEYEQVLQEIKDNWMRISTDERLQSVAAAAVFPAFVPLAKLDKDDSFCLAIDKTAETQTARSWIRSLIQCWCADVKKGRRGNDAARRYLASLHQQHIAMSDAANLVITLVAMNIFWEELQTSMDAELKKKLIEMSTSADNIESMIEELHKNIPAITNSADEITNHIKAEMIHMHEELLADFGE